VAIERGSWLNGSGNVGDVDANLPVPVRQVDKAERVIYVTASWGINVKGGMRIQAVAAQVWLGSRRGACRSRRKLPQLFATVVGVGGDEKSELCLKAGRTESLD
jgi:hypothetical protein